MVQKRGEPCLPQRPRQPQGPRPTGARRPAGATARLLTSEENAAVLAAYQRSHPWAWATLKPVLQTTLGTRMDNDGTSLPMIALYITPHG